MNSTENTTTFFTGGAGNGTKPALRPDDHTRHTLGQNFAFLDGHAKFIHFGKLTGNITQLQNTYLNHTLP